MKELLMQSKYRIYNVAIAHKIGAGQCLVLMELADCEERNGEDFYTSYNQIHLNTALSEKQISFAVKKLKEIGLISTEMKGLPAKQHYTIDYEKVGVVLGMTKGKYKDLQKVSTSSDKRSVLIYKEEQERNKQQPIPTTGKEKEEMILTEEDKKLLCIQ